MPVSHVSALPSLLEALAGLTDPRKRRGVRHTLGSVLAVAVVATLGGACNYRELGSHARDFSPRLLELLGARWHPLRRRHTPPSAGTLRRVLLAVDADALDHVIGQWLRAHAACDGDGWAIALDGKDLHGAWNDEGRLVLLSALTHRSGKRGAVTLAHVQVPAGTTEVTQVEAVLEGVSTARALVTADVAHTCAKTARHLVEDKKAGYLMCVKGNREALHAAAVEVGRVLLNSGQAPHTLIEHGHGRITTWTTWSTDLDGELDLPHAAWLAVLRREVADPLGQSVSKEVVLYVTSRKDLTGGGFSRYARGHWAIGNLEHRARDTVWYEDAQQVYLGHGPRNMAALRNLALSALALHGILKIKEKVQEVGRDHDRALPLLMLT